MITKILTVAISLLLSNFLSAQVNFANQSSSLGLNFSCGTPYLGSGVSFFDFDNDGWDDLSFATGAGHDLMFFKNANGTFIPIDLNLPSITYLTKQINWVDFDNDGDRDLFVTSNSNPNRLYENLGDLNFMDITQSAGFPLTTHYTAGASWGDYNNDGYLDVFWSNLDTTSTTQTPNMLFQNNGDGTFTNVSEIAGIDEFRHLSFCSAFLDINNDGWQDIYISNDKDFNLNQLYRNNGDGTFTEIGESSQTNLAIDAMTVTVGDYDNDGWQDIYVTDTDYSVLLRNNGDETFTDLAFESGTEFDSIGWGAIFLDADCDKDLDLYVSGSLVSNPTHRSAAFYVNNNDGTFTIPQNAGFQNDNFNSFSNAIGDFNNDGLPDFVVTNGNNQNVTAWKNLTNNGNNWLKVTLEGTVSNRDGIGSTIKMTTTGESQYRYTHCGEGYLAQNSSSKFFGLGTNTSIDHIQVTWLSGIVDNFYNISVNQSLHIVEGSGTLGLMDDNLALFSVFPNPVSDKLFFRTTNHLTEVKVYDALMKEIFKAESFTAESFIDVSNWQTGIYFLKATFNQESKTIKIVKR